MKAAAAGEDRHRQMVEKVLGVLEQFQAEGKKPLAADVMAAADVDAPYFYYSLKKARTHWPDLAARYEELTGRKSRVSLAPAAEDEPEPELPEEEDDSPEAILANVICWLGKAEPADRRRIMSAAGAFYPLQEIA